ncbi:MAG: flap endonuclease-1 [Nanoarchaeota archaeon]
MGLQIRDIISRKQIEIKDLKDKVICIDAYNIIYQFLSTIRQPDGTPLKDDKGNITSHLSGLFYRNINLLDDGLKLVYVFDGKPPELKSATNASRKEHKEDARVKFESAKAIDDRQSMGKYSRQMVFINEQIVNESKELLTAMGIAVIQAPSEGEAQAAHLARTNPAAVYAVGSQDYDSLLFGAPRLIQNLTLANKRKTVSGYVDVSPEIIDLDMVLNSLEINLDQLICIGILCGTDYNPGGVRGIGPKRALQIVKTYKQPVLIFNSSQVLERFAQMLSEGNSFDWQTIFELFHKPNVENFPIVFPDINLDEIKRILLSRGFSSDRIDKQLLRIKRLVSDRKQTKLF